MDSTPTLQLVRYDSGANAPEVFLVLADLQVAYNTRPELFYIRSTPEVITEPSEVSTYHEEISRSRVWVSRKFTLALLTVCATIIVTVSIGVGLGMGLKKQQTMIDTSSSFSPSTAATGGSLTIPREAEILNDTSIAAITEQNGDRRLFFQDPSGAIRQAVYSASAKRWINDLGPSVIRNAKYLSPLSVTRISREDLGLNAIFLFYINQTNFLASAKFEDGEWTNGIDPPVGHVAAPDSRYLSAVIAIDNLTGLYLQVFYENQQGNLTSLSGALRDSAWQWDFNDTSSDMYNAWPSIQFAAPFSCLIYDDYEAINPNVTIWLLSFRDASVRTSSLDSNAPAYGLFYAINQSPGNLISQGNQNISEPITDRSILASDIVTVPHLTKRLTFWVWDSSLASLEGYDTISQPLPYNYFPFTRLATAPAINSSTTRFLYHQLDNVTFAEEQWNADGNYWMDAVNITIKLT